ncbi:MAG: hypothetical protein ACTSQJ_20200 [Promethearchaeota archaeon]
MNDIKIKKKIIRSNYQKVFSINNYSEFMGRLDKIVRVAINLKKLDKYEN